MNSFWRFGALVSLILALTACHDDSRPVEPEEYTPELYSFHMIDSYNQDTSHPPYTDLALNPSEPEGYEGLFEVFWRVNSLEDYTVSLRINDRPSIGNSLNVHSEVCGAGRWCDQDGSLVCEYTNDFFLSCDNSGNYVDILELFADVPQQLYLFLEACDNNSSYCEYNYYPVIFE